jgi:Polyketide cyclase / dehydrase and lipid transport
MATAYTWLPLLALAFGGISGLGALRSFRSACLSGVVAICVQVVGWSVAILVMDVMEHGWNEEWRSGPPLGLSLAGGVWLKMRRKIDPRHLLAGGVRIGRILEGSLVQPAGGEMVFEQSVLISASPGDLFALSQDYDRRLQWDPFLKSAKLLVGTKAAGVGVRAFCIAHNGWAMETEYVAFNPPRTCAVKMTNGPCLIGRFAGSWRFEEISSGQTKVVFKYLVRARPAWLSWLITPIIGWLFARDTRRRLSALKAAAESESFSAGHGAGAGSGG